MNYGRFKGKYILLFRIHKYASYILWIHLTKSCLILLTLLVHYKAKSFRRFMYQELLFFSLSLIFLRFRKFLKGLKFFVKLNYFSEKIFSCFLRKFAILVFHSRFLWSWWDLFAMQFCYALNVVQRRCQHIMLIKFHFMEHFLGSETCIS